MNQADRAKSPSCFKCRHFQITWQPQRPYACLAMGFKSQRLPSLVVMQSSGGPCLSFSPKPGQQP